MEHWVNDSAQIKKNKWKLRIWSYLLEKSFMENFIFREA